MFEYSRYFFCKKVKEFRFEGMDNGKFETIYFVIWSQNSKLFAPFDDLFGDKTSTNTQAGGNAVAKQHSSTAINRSSFHQ